VTASSSFATTRTHGVPAKAERLGERQLYKRHRPEGCSLRLTRHGVAPHLTCHMTTDEQVNEYVAAGHACMDWHDREPVLSLQECQRALWLCTGGFVHVPGVQRSSTTPLQPSRTMDNGLAGSELEGWGSGRAPPLTCVPAACLLPVDST